MDDLLYEMGDLKKQLKKAEKGIKQLQTEMDEQRKKFGPQ